MISPCRVDFGLHGSNRQITLFKFTFFFSIGLSDSAVNLFKSYLDVIDTAIKVFALLVLSASKSKVFFHLI